MSWFESLQSASFRGVEFKVSSSESTGGRLSVKHEYPQRDTHYVEDLGRKGRGFTVEAFVVGEDYFAKRDALLSALEEAGPGELVHPYLGTRRVVCTEYRIRESTQDGRMARFGLTLEETEIAPQYPTAEADERSALLSAADTLESSVVSEFHDEYSTENQPARTLASLSSVIESAHESVSDLVAPLVTVSDDLAAMRRALGNLVSDTDALLRAPSDVTDAFLAVTDEISSVAMLPRRGIDALLDAAGFTPSVSRPEGTTPVSTIEQTNYDSLSWMMAVLLIASSARLSADAEYDSYTDAVGVRDRIMDAIDAVTGDVPDDTFSALEALRVALASALPGVDSDLPRLLSFTPPVSVPSVVVAHQLYGHLDLELDLLARNDVLRPMFVPGQVALEVLSDA